MNGGESPAVRGAIVAAVAAALWTAGCSSTEEPRARAEVPIADGTTSSTTSSTTTEAPATTEDDETPTDGDETPLFEPLYADPTLDPEAQVEAAYHHHWEILLDASQHGRTDYLHLVYTGEALEMRIGEIEGFVADGHHVGGHVEHNYAINIRGPTDANVIDGYWNHLVKTDPVSGEPISEPSGDQIVQEFVMVKEDDRWLVSRVIRHTFS